MGTVVLVVVLMIGAERVETPLPTTGWDACRAEAAQVIAAGAPGQVKVAAYCTTMGDLIEKPLKTFDGFSLG